MFPSPFRVWDTFLPSVAGTARDFFFHDPIRNETVVISYPSGPRYRATADLYNNNR